MAFTHLHVHTEYSLLDGAARIKDLVAKVKELGMTSVAITDHGAMYGVIDFYRACKDAGIKPILGCEVYTAARTMADKDPEKDKYQGHLLLLAENDEGYHHLMKIVSEAFVHGYYYKPRVDKELLRRYSGGIIATSACLAGDVQRHLLNGDYEGAKKEALEYLDIFGEGNFFLELFVLCIIGFAKLLIFCFKGFSQFLVFGFKRFAELFNLCIVCISELLCLLSLSIP